MRGIISYPKCAREKEIGYTVATQIERRIAFSCRPPGSVQLYIDESAALSWFLALPKLFFA